MLDINPILNVDLNQLESLNAIAPDPGVLELDRLATPVFSSSVSAPAVDFSSFERGRLPDAVRNGDRIQRATADDFVLNGGRGNDILYGTDGHHLLKGRAGDDYLEALSGEDWLIGGRGSDILVDSVGGSVLTGGSGADQFWVERWAKPEAASIITDFKAGQDQIKVGRLGATFDQLQLQDSLLGVTISDQGHAIARLWGVRSNQLNASDFVFGDPNLADQLQSTLEREQQAFGSPGTTAATITPDGFTWQGASGLADINTQASMQPDDIMGIGSTSKAFTGVAALKLQEKGILNLNDTLGQWAPDIAQNLPDGESITLRQLLDGTAGITAFLFMPQFQQRMLEDPLKPLTTDEVFNWVYSEPRAQGWEYPETSMMMAAIMIERITGKSFSEVLREEILDPLGLNHSFSQSVETVVGKRARGYQGAFASDGSLIQDGGISDYLNDMNLSFNRGAGGLISTAQDLAQFSQALFKGALLSSESLQELLDFVPVAPTLGWGLGIEQTPLPWGDAWGRGGNDGSFSADVAYLPNQGMTTAVIFNRDYLPGLLQGTSETIQPQFNLRAAMFEDVLGAPPQDS